MSHASAHPYAASSFKLHVSGNKMSVFMVLDGPTLVAVLEQQLGGDRGLVTGQTILAARDSITSYLDANLSIDADSRECKPGQMRAFEVLSGGNKVKVFRDYDCSAPPQDVTVENVVFMEDEGGHKHHAFFHVGPDVLRHTFNTESKTFRFDARPALDAGAPPPDWAASPDVEPDGVASAVRPSASVPKGFFSYFAEFFGPGVLHILIGIDHVLFVVALLVAVRTFRRLALVVTSFTLAHSVTLALGALDLVVLSPRLVESLIALSIVYVGLENVLRDEPKVRHVVTFGFGLMHGFGFSSVLRDLGWSADEGLVPSLLAFNLGVEVGQLLVVAPLFPLCRWLADRDEDCYRRIRDVTSGVVAALGFVWLVERAFGVAILGV